MRKPQDLATFPTELWSFLEKYKRDVGPRFGPYACVIKHHVDGDTVDIYCDSGLNEYPYKIVRLTGYDAPEMNTRDADEKARGHAALAYLQALAPVGTPCVFYDNAKDAETFGRYIGRLMLPGMIDVTRAMITAGHIK